MIKNVDDSSEGPGPSSGVVEKRGGAAKPLVTRKGKPDGRSLKNAASASIAREALKEYIKKGKKACTKKEEKKAYDSDSGSEEIVYHFPTIQAPEAPGIIPAPVEPKAESPWASGISSGVAPALQKLQKKIDKLLSKRKAKKEKKKALARKSPPPIPVAPPPSPAIAGPPAHSQQAVVDSLRKKFLLRF